MPMPTSHSLCCPLTPQCRPGATLSRPHAAPGSTGLVLGYGPHHRCSSSPTQELEPMLVAFPVLLVIGSVPTALLIIVLDVSPCPLPHRSSLSPAPRPGAQPHSGCLNPYLLPRQRLLNPEHEGGEKRTKVHTKAQVHVARRVKCKQ
jgi:hypothetical protein